MYAEECLFCSSPFIKISYFKRGLVGDFDVF